MAINLDKHPKAKEIAVKPHDLSLYDQLHEEVENEDEGGQEQ